jgi:tetratricopeptide (TPR) repeat protein
LKKTLKRQMKQDELVSSYAQVESWTRTHADEIKATAAGVLVVALAVGGLWYFRSHRAAAAAPGFDEAMEAFAAATTNSAPKPGQPQQPAREETLRKALAAFEGVAGRYQSLPAGLRARYFAAVCRIDLGDIDPAQKELRDLATRTGGPSASLEAALARLALAGLARRQKQLGEAIQTYEAILADASTALPRDYVLFALAETLDEAGRVKEAAAAFRRLVDEQPQSAFASEARSRADYLKLAAAQ